MPQLFLTRMNNERPIPSFAKKGAGDQMPGVVGDVPVVVSTSFFALPARVFRYIIFAIMLRAVQYVGDKQRNHNVFKPITTLAHVYETPVCTFRFKDLTPADITELKAMGLQQDLANKNLFVGSPSSHLLPRIMALGPIEDRIRPGHLSFEGYLAYVYLMKGIQIYTTTKNSINKNGINTVFSVGTPIKEGETGQLRRMDGSLMAFTNDLKVGTIGQFSGSYVIAPNAVDMSGFPGAVRDITTNPTFGNAVFFPYFSGMNTADKSTSWEVFSAIFQGTLSDKVDADIRIMNRVRAGIRNISFSRTGMALAHIYKCIGISMDICSAKITILVKGNVYVGTVIEGEFSVSMYGKTVVAGDISKDIAHLNLLESQAQEIADKLNSVQDLEGNSVYNFTQLDFMKSRSALRAFNSVDPDLFHSSSILDDARQTLLSMEYGDSFPLVPTQDLVFRAIRYMATGDFSLIEDFPAYLDGGILFHRSRVWEALSLFGDRAPSCNIGDNKSQKIIIPGPGKNDTNLVKVDGVRPLHYIPFWTLPVGVAAVQWDKLFSSGMFLIPHGRKGKKEFTNLSRVVFSISSDPVFSDAYNLLKGMVNDARKEGALGGKRKRGDDNSGRGAKKAKAMDLDDI